MSLIWFILGFAFGALIAPGIIFFLLEKFATPDEPRTERHCPPCDGNCHQGRNCPAK